MWSNFTQLVRRRGEVVGAAAAATGPVEPSETLVGVHRVIRQLETEDEAQDNHAECVTAFSGTRLRLRGFVEDLRQWAVAPDYVPVELVHLDDLTPKYDLGDATFDVLRFFNDIRDAVRKEWTGAPSSSRGILLPLTMVLPEPATVVATRAENEFNKMVRLQYEAQLKDYEDGDILAKSGEARRAYSKASVVSVKVAKDALAVAKTAAKLATQAALEASTKARTEARQASKRPAPSPAKHAGTRHSPPSKHSAEKERRKSSRQPPSEPGSERSRLRVGSRLFTGRRDEDRAPLAPTPATIRQPTHERNTRFAKKARRANATSAA